MKKGKKIGIIALILVCIIGVIMAISQVFKFYTSENSTASSIEENTYLGQIKNWLTSHKRSYGTYFGTYNQKTKAWENKWLFYDTQDTVNDVYCIKSGTSHANTYNTYDLYNIDNNLIKDVFKDESNYNHFMWILENMYVSNPQNNINTDEKQLNTLLEKIAKYNGKTTNEIKTLYNNMNKELAGKIGALTTYNSDKSQYALTLSNKSTQKFGIQGTFIKSVQDYLLYHYAIQDNNGGNPLNANESGWKIGSNKILDKRLVIMKNQTEPLKDNGGNYVEIGNDTSSKKFVSYLYNYLQNGYNANTYNINKYKNFSKDNVQLINKAKIANKDNTIVGPFTLKNEKEYAIENVYVYKNGEKLDKSKYSFVNFSGEKIQSVSNGELYIKFVDEVANGDKITMSLKVNFGEVTKAELLVPESGQTKGEQNIIKVSRKQENRELKTEVILYGENKELDIALKKVITAVNDVSVESRLNTPDYIKNGAWYGKNGQLYMQNDGINLEQLAKQESTTATYFMNKTPVKVKVGDIVDYELKIYNEGQAKATAAEIKDYLPNGLELLDDEYDNTAIYMDQYGDMGTIGNPIGWTYDADTRCITITKLDEIAKSNKNNVLNALTVTKDSQEKITNITLDSKTIHLRCKVTDVATGILTNIAEITKYGMIVVNKDNGSEFYISSTANCLDRDSVISNSTINNSNLSNIDRTSDAWINYSNDQDNRLDGTLHIFHGQEDDDDFEKLEIEKSKYKLIIEKQDKEDNTKKLPGSKFTIECDGQVIQEDTSLMQDDEATGMCEIEKDIESMKATYRILETDAQGGYTNIFGDNYITLDINFSEGKINGIPSVNIVSPDGSVLDKTEYNELYSEVIPSVNDNKDTVTLIIKNPKQKDFDLSLRKFITKVEDKVLENNDIRVPVLNEDSYKALLENKTAEYYHQKKAVKVQNGDEIVYTIRVYNEGDQNSYDGYAKKITDYLPQGLTYVGLEQGYESQYKATYNKQRNSVDIEYIGNAVLPANSIRDNTYQEVSLICYVEYEGDFSEIKVLTNRAEITEKVAGTITNGVFNKEDNIVDRDNESTIEQSLNLDTWYSEHVSEDLPLAYYPGEEDDDDFESVYLEPNAKKFDLSLRKFITSVERNGQNIDIGIDRTPKINSMAHVTSLLNFGRMDYWHTKKAVEVENGDVVTYTIRVYNEGELTGRVGEITDYLPEGLQICDDNGNIVTSGQVTYQNGYTWNVDGKTIKTNSLKDIDITKNELARYQGDPSNEEWQKWFKDVTVKCKVVAQPTKNIQYLTNRAEITAHEDVNGNKYGKYYNAYQNTDIDSVPDTIATDLRLENWYVDNVDESKDNEYSFYSGIQEDDDFETVKISPAVGYKLSLSKESVGTNGEYIEDTSALFTIKEIDQNGNVLNTLKDNEEINATQEIDAKTNVKTNTKIHYLIKEEKSNDENQIIFNEIKVDVNVLENASVNAEIVTVDGEEYDASKYGKLLSIVPDSNNENGFILKIANRKKKDIIVQLEKVDEDGNQITAYFDMYENGVKVWNGQQVQGNLKYTTNNMKFDEEYTYELLETNASTGYKNILGNNKIQIKLKMTTDGVLQYLSGDKKYQIYNVNNDLISPEDNLYNYVKVIPAKEGEVDKVTIRVTNKSKTNYNFEVWKVDKDNEEKYLENARFTIDGPNGNILNDKALISKVDGKGGVFVKENIEARLANTYTYTIKETYAEPLYENVFDFFDIKVDVAINNDGLVDIQKSKISATNLQGDQNEATQILNDYVRLELAQNNTIRLVIKNPMQTRDFKLSLLKKEIDSDTPVVGAVFTLRQLKSGGNPDNLKDYEIINNNITTREDAFEIGSETNCMLKTSYTYIIEENNAPGKYSYKYKSAKIKVDITDEGNVEARIVSVTENQTGTEEQYDEAKHSKYVRLVPPDGSNNITFVMTNSSPYTLVLRKRGYDISDENHNLNEYNNLPLLFNTRFTVDEEYNGEKKQVLDANSTLTYRKEESGANREYKYYIKEQNPAEEGYINTFSGITILVTVKTGINGEVLPQGARGSKIEFVKDNGNELSLAEMVYYSKLCKLNIAGSSNEVTLDIIDEKKPEVEPNYYKLQIVKVDEETKQLMDGVEFRVTMPDQTSYDADTNTEGVQNPVTKNGGVIDLEKREITNAIETFKITEMRTIAGYNLLDGIDITANINLTNVTTAEDITKDNIEIVVSGENKSLLEGKVSCIVTSDKTIQIVIPNTPKQFEFELNKVDSLKQGNLIVAEKKQNGILDGTIIQTNVYRTVDGKKLAEFNGILEEGKILDKINSMPNTKFVCNIIETKSKSGYINVFEGYRIEVTINTDENAQVSSATYKVVDLKNQALEYTDKFYNYIKLTNTNTKVTLDIENPVGYKVRLNKVDTSNNAVTVSNLEAYLNGQRRCAVNGSYTVAGSNESYQLTGESSHLSEDIINITPGEMQVWKIYEKGVKAPYINVFKDKYIEVQSQMNVNGEFNVLGYTIKNDSDNSKLSEDEENLLKSYIGDIKFVKENKIPILDITLKNPQKFNFKIVKTNLDTGDRLNNVQFSATIFDENDKEVKLRKASNPNEYIDLSNLVTSQIGGEDGTINIEDILLDKTGKYIFKLHEVTPELWKEIEDIWVEVSIVQENGKYDLRDMKVVKGSEGINTDNTKILNEETAITLQIGVDNKKIKGDYDLEINKLDKLTKKQIDGAKFEVTVIKDGKEAELYDASSTSNNKVLVPNEVEVKDGKVTICNIKIDKPETYIIKLQETRAPDKYLSLEETIELEVTTDLEGERFVLKEARLIQGENNGLVSKENSDNKIKLTIENEQFDLSLRKFITKVISNEGEENEKITETENRIPDPNVEKLKDKSATTAEYYHSKNSLQVYAQDTIIYTIRVYNEGDVSGYAEEIIDHLPENLEFVNDNFNASYGWLLDEADKSLRTVKTSYLSKLMNEKDNLINGFNKDTGELSYKEVQIKCKVKSTAKLKEKITNIAEISKYVGENGRKVVDRDSSKLVELPKDEDLPGYKDSLIQNAFVEGQEDDDDFEKIAIEEFDLSLRKFITGVTAGNGTKNEVASRVPVFKIDENGKYVYNHDKEPVLVGNQSIVEYTLRVYNEGSIDGYANKIKDNIPDGLEFVPDNEINKTYGWVMIDEQGKETNEINKAKYVVTDYLSNKQEKTEGDNLLKAFDKERYEAGEVKEPNYKEVKVAFKVTVPNTEDTIIINEAQISDDSDKDGNDVTDKDSTPDKWIEGEDDQDIEKIKVQYFDLSLRKWVTKAIVIEDGKETISQTGHKAEDDPEEVIKVDLKRSKLNKVVVKFEYQIRVTNEGRIAGYVKEISDYIPEGLKFVAVDNEGWKEEEGKVVTDVLKDTLIQPGESKEVTIRLTWINREDNMGLKVNTAEISKDYNEYGTQDIDSTPNNKVPGEDDIDDAPVMITVKTGEMIVYIGITIASLTIIAVGAYTIKKYVIR